MTSLKIWWTRLPFWYFLKYFIYYHIHAKFPSQCLTGKWFMMGDPFDSPGYLTSKKPRLLRVNGWKFIETSLWMLVNNLHSTKMKFSVKDFLHLLKKLLMENFMFCAVFANEFVNFISNMQSMKNPKINVMLVNNEYENLLQFKQTEKKKLNLKRMLVNKYKL